MPEFYTWTILFINQLGEIGEKQLSVFGARGGQICPLMQIPLCTIYQCMNILMYPCFYILYNSIYLFGFYTSFRDFSVDRPITNITVTGNSNKFSMVFLNNFVCHLTKVKERKLIFNQHNFLSSQFSNTQCELASVYQYT